jgi:GMP synthase PP-ATPase subunit
LNRWLVEKKSDAEIVESVFQLALARRPTADEKQRFLAVLNEAKNETERREALEDTFWAVLTGREFLFNR